MPISAPPPSWASIKNKPTTVAGFGISDMASQSVNYAATAGNGGVTSLNGQTGAVTDTSLYAIGSFVIGRPANITAYAVNSTIAGSSLYATGPGGYYNSVWNDGLVGPAQTLVNTGTWRCVAPCPSQGGNGGAGLWVRTA